MRDGSFPLVKFNTIIGSISNENSLIKSINDSLLLVSCKNVLNLINKKTLEIKEKIILKNQIKITCLDFIEENNHILILIGTSSGEIKHFKYQNQKLKELNSFKFSNHKIIDIKIYMHENSKMLLFATSKKLISFNLESEEVFIKFGGLNSTILNFVVSENLIFCNFSDNSVKAWSLELPTPLAVYAFDNKIYNLVVCENYILYKKLESIFYLKFVSKSSLKNDKESDKNSLSEEKLNFVEEKEILNLKKLKNFKEKNDKLFVFTDKKFYVFDVKISENLSLNQSFNKNFESKNVADFLIEEKGIFIANSDNKIEYLKEEKSYKATKILSFHNDDIFYSCILDGILITVSNFQILIWELQQSSNDSLKDFELKNSINFEDKITGVANYAKIKDFILISTENNLIKAINIKTTEIYVLEEDFRFKISSFNNFLIKQNDQNIEIMEINEKKFNAKNFNFFQKNVKNFTERENILTFSISPDEKLIAIAITGNEVLVYDLDTQNHLLTLFGHSLPVVSISFDPSSSRIITSSADKLIKIFGAKFGELQKTLHLNSNFNVFLDENYYLNGGENLNLVNKFEIQKKILARNKIMQKDPELLSFNLLNDKYFITGNKDIIIYDLNDYGYIIEDKDLNEETEQEIYENLKTTDLETFEKILNSLENIENFLKELTIEDKNMILESGNYFEQNKTFCKELSNLMCDVYNIPVLEIKSIFRYFNINQVRILLKGLISNLEDFNLIKSSRIYLEIVKIHGEVIKELKIVAEIREKIEERVFVVREIVGKNYAKNN